MLIICLLNQYDKIEEYYYQNIRMLNNQIQYQHPFIMRRYGRTGYRIITQKFQSNMVTIQFCVRFLLTLSLLYIIISLASLIQIPNFTSIISAISVGGCALQSKFTFDNSLYVPKKLMLWSIILTLFCMGMLVTSILSLKIYRYVGGGYSNMLFYIVICQVFVPWFYIPNKIQVLFKILMTFQIIVICLKLDNRVDVDWKIGLSIPYNLSIALLFVSLVIITYIIVNLKWYYQQQIVYRYYGLFSIALMLWSISCCILTLTTYFFGSYFWIVCAVTSFSCAFVAWYLNQYLNHIVVFISPFQPVQSHQQMISILQINQQSILSRKYHRKSHNLCVEYVSQKQINIDQQQIGCLAVCLICMCEDANTLWDCGHLTTCWSCYQDLLIKKSMNCILCKKQPSVIMKLTMVSNIYNVNEAYYVKMY